MATKLEDSNMALFGTEVEKNLKYKNAQNEPEWHTIPQEPCLMVWRVENTYMNFGVKAWPKERYGEFYQGDTYIVLHVTKENNTLCYTAYMWVGKDTSTDEAGTGAYKIVELDDFFHGAVDLEYEAQSDESEEFEQLFKEITILEGGIASGFRKVEEETYKVRLLKVETKIGSKTTEVPLKMSSLTKEDGFVLDTGLEIYSWRGENSKPTQKFNCASVCQKIQRERNGKPNITIFEEGDKGTKAIMEKYLEDDLKGKDKPIKLRSANKRKKKMFKLSDESGKLEMAEVPYEKESLDSNSAFLIDNKDSIYVWTGKNASKNEKRYGFLFAKKYMEDLKLKIDCSIIVAKEGSKKVNIEEILE